MKAIKQSGRILWYFNQNQIHRMKGRKNELQIKPTKETDVYKHIRNVVQPFEQQIKSQKLTVLTAIDVPERTQLITDWSMVEYVLFNAVQNAIKYNVYSGVVVLLVSFRMQLDSAAEQLVIKVVDTGLGIDKELQQMLFKPFKELNSKQNFRKL